MVGFARQRTQPPEYWRKNEITLGTCRTYFNNNLLASTTYKWPGLDYLKSYKECEDELHPGPPWKTGGPLFIRQKTYDDAFCSGTWTRSSGSWRWEYGGMFTITRASDPLMSQFDALTTEAWSYGAEAWNKFRPVKPRANMGVFLGELRDVPGMIKSIGAMYDLLKNLFSGKFSLKRGDVGSHYLAYRFGFAPFVKDLLDFYKLNKKLSNHLRYIRNHNGKWTMRGGTVKKLETEVIDEIPSCLYPAVVSYLYQDPTHLRPCKIEKRTMEHVWFKARMKYYIPEERFSVDKAFSPSLVRHLYGGTLTPSLAWKLLPWSWLIDWFLNWGDILSNIDNNAYDNLVAKYAYVMRMKTIQWLYHQQESLYGGPMVNVESIYRVEIKERAVGSQFGFGSGSNPLSGRQMAILAALGIQASQV